MVRKNICLNYYNNLMITSNCFVNCIGGNNKEATCQHKLEFKIIIVSAKCTSHIFISFGQKVTRISTIAHWIIMFSTNINIAIGALLTSRMASEPNVNSYVLSLYAHNELQKFLSLIKFYFSVNIPNRILHKRDSAS